ncbi:MAG TPA: hypothetical protein VD761_02350 [Solirubrobacterales bacterium]|nr:hypothetical protein [Solirubrobacterales bacterium]
MTEITSVSGRANHLPAPTQTASVPCSPGEPRLRGGSESQRNAAPPPLQAVAGRLGLAFLACGVLALFVAIVAPSAQALTFGGPGSGDGQLALAAQSGVTVNEDSGDVYVADTNNHRVSQFTSTGTFIRAWGADVGGAGVDVCTTGCVAGTPGSEPGAFDLPTFVAVDNSGGASAGAVYVADTAAGIVTKFSAAGTLITSWGVAGQLDGSTATDGPFGFIAGIAVDSSGSLAVLDQNAGFTATRFFKFSDAGAFETEFVPSARGTLSNGLAAGNAEDFFKVNGGKEIERFLGNGTDVGQVSQSESTNGLATDLLTGTLFSNDGSYVSAYVIEPSGEVGGTGCTPVPGSGCSPSYTFGGGSITGGAGIAVDASAGTVFLAETGGRIQVFAPAQLASASTDEVSSLKGSSATLNGSVNPKGQEVTSCVFEYGPEAGTYGDTIPCAETSAEIGTGEQPVQVHADLETLTPGTEYHFRLAVETVGGPSKGADQPFKTLGPPIISAEKVSGVVFTEATFGALIIPEGAETIYRVEYGLDTSYGFSSSPTSIGSDRVGKSVTLTLNDLEPNTAYHWRLIASNEFGETVGPDNTFKTFGIMSSPACPNDPFRRGVGATLPDCRAYEMVSPVDKNNGDIKWLTNIATNPARLNQAALSGEKLTYSTSQGFADPEGVPYVSQYLASRSPAGWINRPISPSQGRSATEVSFRADIEYRAFTSELCTGALLHHTDPALAPGAVEGFFNVYKRDLCETAGIEAVSVVTPPVGANPTFYIPNVQGMSDDGRCVVYQARVDSDMAIFESCNGRITPVNLLPDGGEESSAAVGTAVDNIFGAPRTGSVQNAVSGDGTRIYWTGSIGGEGPLYLRKNADQEQSAVMGGQCTEPTKGCTFAVSANVTSGPAHFWAASVDGSRAFFSAEGSLYEYEADADQASLIAGGFVGFMGAGRDATSAYFVSEESLTAPNPEGNEPAPGQANLYRFDSTNPGPERLQFVGALSAFDARRQTIQTFTPINEEPYLRTSRVTPDGRSALFLSTARLSDYDNTEAGTGEQVGEIYLYDARSGGKITCVSCNPAGQRPQGRIAAAEGKDFGVLAAALLPPYQTELYGSRVVTDRGDRVFFEGLESLVPADTNGKTDVYQWESPGTGSCTTQAAAYSLTNNGCVSLISSGDSPSDSEFIDASPDGSDVFFSTASSLVPQDPGLIDIYDARIGGGFPVPVTPPPGCEGQACQVPGVAPTITKPGSSVFTGNGNKKQKKGKKKKAKGKKHKGKKKAKGRKHKGNHARATTKGRAGR